MADDRYRELYEKKQRERASASAERANERQQRETLDRLYFEWREGVVGKLRQRASDLQRDYPDLGQVFFEATQDDVRIHKSKLPGGDARIIFDRDGLTITCEFAFFDRPSQAPEDMSFAAIMELAEGRAPDVEVTGRDYAAFRFALDEPGTAIQIVDLNTDASREISVENFVDAVYDRFMKRVM